MAFTIPEGLHPDLNPLAWMIGTWRGKGRGDSRMNKAVGFFNNLDCLDSRNLL